MVNFSSTLMTVPVDHIDLKNTKYKISKNNISEDFEKSIKQFGILDTPLLLKNDNAFIVLFGLNRIKASIKVGANSIEACIVDSIEPDQYKKLALLKVERDEVGVIGKVKIFIILKELNVYDDNEMRIILHQGLNLSHQLMKDKMLSIKITSLPQELLDYIDDKNFNFKIIQNVLAMSDEYIEGLTNWIAVSDLKVNLFRRIVEMLYDLSKKNRNDLFDESSIDDIEDRRERANVIFKELFVKRYPHYSSLEELLKKIQQELRKKNWDVQFPQYFEGDRFGLTLMVHRSDNIEIITNRINGIPKGLIQELQKML